MPRRKTVLEHFRSIKGSQYIQSQVNEGGIRKERVGPKDDGGLALPCYSTDFKNNSSAQKYI